MLLLWCVSFAVSQLGLEDSPPILWVTNLGKRAPINAAIAVGQSTKTRVRRLFVNTGASIAALDPLTGEVLWNSSAGIPIDPDPHVGGTPQGLSTPVYEPTADLVLACLATRYGTIIALDAKKGKPRWIFNASILPNNNFYTYEANPVIVYRTASKTPLLIANINGDTIAVQVSDGEEVWRRPMVPLSTTNPSCAASLPLHTQNGSVFCCSGGMVMAMDSQTGQTKWSSLFKDKGCAFPGAVPGPNGSVIVTTVGGTNIYYSSEPHVLSFDMNTGDQNWNTSIGTGNYKLGTIAGAAISADRQRLVTVQLSTPALTLDANNGNILASGTAGSIPHPGGSPYPLRFNGPLSFHPSNHSQVFAVTYGMSESPAPFNLASYDVNFKVGWQSLPLWRQRWRAKLGWPAGQYSAPSFLEIEGAKAKNGRQVLMFVGDTNGTVCAWGL